MYIGSEKNSKTLGDLRYAFFEQHHPPWGGGCCFLPHRNEWILTAVLLTAIL